MWKYPNEIFYKEIFFITINITLFSATTFAASAVNVADKNAKKSNIKILRSLSKEGRSKTKESIDYLFQICHNTPFTLRGWYFFQFTGEFYLTTVGCFITYTLLIINL